MSFPTYNHCEDSKHNDSPVESPNKGHFLWDQYKFKWFVHCIEIVLFKRLQSHFIDRGDKIWGEISYLRDSTVVVNYKSVTCMSVV